MFQNLRQCKVGENKHMDFALWLSPSGAQQSKEEANYHIHGSRLYLFILVIDVVTYLYKLIDKEEQYEVIIYKCSIRLVHVLYQCSGTFV